MTTYFLIFSFILGTLIGSFLNVVALRYNTGMTLNGRSKCFSCGKNLTWHELIPIFSFLFQWGKCKKCKSKISWQYPVIESVAGILFVMIFYVFPPVTVLASFDTIFYIFITCLLLIITIYDIKHKIIPDPLVYTFAVVAFARLFISPDLSFAIPSVSALLAGPVLALPFALMFWLSKGTWMGFGDAKLVLGIGWVLGIFSGISAIVLAFWIGAIVSVIWMYIVFKKLKSKQEIPFGPYLILGMYLVLLFNIQVIDLRPFIDYFFIN
jgi:prepilin signal peptidase PulO-like enzyme (type II secretory pathway)